ncbi:MAG: 2-amino-4-hydroxy-6-hydroxymethyldihydropteridine diphosphokinase [Alphaproteobacteria bacterium]|nr:2-amino-4-hydroxy-6-hydroxymethyldihydropteridine diphosphokinase [Alphaproteobacteria bacterium]
MILVAIGANLPGLDGRAPLDTCRATVEALDRLPGLRVASVSRWYRTRPLPPSGQPDYVNGAVRLTGAADPAVLLGQLQGIEAAAGRRRSQPNAARTLDLDLIGIGALVRSAPDPVIPHPRLHERAFVLVPLAELVPGWIHPVLGRSVADLLDSLSSQAVDPL